MVPCWGRTPATNLTDTLRQLCCVMQNIKKKFPVVLGTINQLIERLHALGPEASIDVDQAALRVTLDVIGLVSGWHAACHAACAGRRAAAAAVDWHQ